MGESERAYAVVPYLPDNLPVYMKKVAVLALSALAFALTAFVAPGAAFAKGGLPNTGTTSCGKEITGLKLTSGGNQGGHVIGPDSMHVFVDFNYTPCVPWGRINVEVRDAVTNEIIGSPVTWRNPDPYYVYTWMTPSGPITTSTWIHIATMFQGGIQKAVSHAPGDAKFSHPYAVTITAYDWFTGVTTSTVTGSIVTDKQL